MLLRQLLSFLAPFDCLGCGQEGALVCAACSGSIKPVAECCYLCRAPAPCSVTCLPCRSRTAVSAVHAATAYEGIAKELVWRLKFGRARDAAREVGRFMARNLTGLEPRPMVVTFVPTASNRVRERGYDQAELIARQVAAELSLPCRRLLMRQGSHKQVGASRATRKAQLRGAFRPIRQGRINGVSILLVDDVVTTGATLEAAAEALKQAGAKRVEAAVFARA